MILLTNSLLAVPLDQEAPPRVRVAPENPVANSWEDAADLSDALGVTLDEWQEDVLVAALGEKRNGNWAARQVGLSAPRQNGKSQLIVARFLVGALLFGEKKIIVSAHQQDTARETFNKFLEIMDESEALQKRVRKVMSAFNREFIQFTNGATVQFKARAGAGGRGFSCDCLLLDEAQILSQRVWVSINSTMSARSNPQVWLLGTPPTPDDDGEVFAAVRAAALRGEATGLAYLEWAADLGDDPALERTRWKANPAWNTRINREVVEDEYSTYSREDFARDRLGIWDDVSAVGKAFSKSAWEVLSGDKPSECRVVYGVKFAVDGSGVALAAAYKPKDGAVFVEPIKQRNMGEGTQWLVDFLVERHKDAAQIVIDGKAGVGYLINALQAAGVRNKNLILTPSVNEVKSAHSMFEQGVITGSITHPGNDKFNDQVLNARKRKIGNDGGFGWEAEEGKTVTSLDAATLALWGANTTKRHPGRKQAFL